MPKTIVEIDPEKIDITKPAQLRRYGPSEGAIAAKAASLKRVGQLQPIRVVAGRNGKYEAIYGAERVLAARKLKKKVLAEVVKKPSAKDAFIAGLIENTDHDQMSPIDKAYAIQTLIKKHRMSRRQVAALFGHDQPWLSKTLKLLDLSEEQQKRVHAGELSARDAYEMLTAGEGIEGTRSTWTRPSPTRSGVPLLRRAARRPKRPKTRGTSNGRSARSASFSGRSWTRTSST